VFILFDLPSLSRPDDKRQIEATLLRPVFGEQIGPVVYAE
jgi:hypothetical protein